jgi:hypothetical protein
MEDREEAIAVSLVASAQHRQRAGERIVASLLGVLLCLGIPACSGEDDIPFIGNPLPLDPRCLTVSLDTCECDTCRVALVDPDGSPVPFDEINPPLGQLLVADFCYSAEDIRLIVECGECSTGGPCTAEATAWVDGSDCDTPVAGTLGTVTCTTPAIMGGTCGDNATFSFDTPAISQIINTNCPM